MKTKDQNLILEQMLNYLKKEKRGMLMVDCLVVLAVMLSLIWAIMEPMTLIVAIIVIIYAAIYLWLRSDLFEISDKRKNLQLLELAVSKTKRTIPFPRVESYLLDIAPSKDRAALYVRLQNMILPIICRMDEENENNILYDSPSFESTMLLFFVEISMTQKKEREEFLREIKKLNKFFSRF